MLTLIGSYTDRGAFADFVRGDADRLWKIPENISFEEASTLNVGTMTAVQALFRSDRLGLVEPPQKVTEETWVSTFQFLIQKSTQLCNRFLSMAEALPSDRMPFSSHTSAVTR